MTEIKRSPDYLKKISAKLKEHYKLTSDDCAEAIPLSAPPVNDTVDSLKGLIELLLPARRLRSCQQGQVFLEQIDEEVSRIYGLLRGPVKEALPYRWIAAAESTRMEGSNGGLSDSELDECVETVMKEFFSLLPKIRAAVVKDIQAAYDGDPAALSFVEVTLSFPGLLAIVSHRITHELYRLKVPILPRLMSEWTHNKTGVDIHPGAQIGESFFIDHATGVVIGETAKIGNHVKLYQGVTLGAKSFALDEDGHPVKHIQRHPTVQDGVVIYANATILGGDTVIGKNSTIGGNVFITNSVPSDSVVFRSEEGPKIRAKN